MPYSDNLYSALDSDEESMLVIDQQQQQQDENSQDQESALSPTDGYFHASSSPPAPYTQDFEARGGGPQSANVPHVPNVWVEDPSLRQASQAAESKAREVHQETLLNHPPESERGSSPYNSTWARPAAPPGTSGQAQTLSAFPSRPSHDEPRGPDADVTSSSSASIRRQATSTYAQPHYAAYSPSSSAPLRSPAHRRGPYSERVPFIPAEAPPAYTPSPTSPTHLNPTTYSTFPPASSMGRADESRRLLGSRPQSMSDPDELEHVGPVWRERVRRRLPFIHGRSCKLMLISLVLLGITAGFLTTLIMSTKQERVDTTPSPAPDIPSGPSEPIVKHPNDDDGASRKYPVVDDEMEWNRGSHCKENKYKVLGETYTLDFTPGRNFSLQQIMGRSDDDWHTRSVVTCGNIVLRRTTADTRPSLVIEAYANDERLTVDALFNGEDQDSVLTTLRSISAWNDERAPCVMVRATIWIPEDGELDQVILKSTQLDIKLMDNLALKVSQSLSVENVVGDIASGISGSSADKDLVKNGSPESYRLDARHIELHTVSGNIVGSYPLYDSLSITTVSGDIKVGVEPKSASKEHVESAKLYAKSSSGGVELWEPLHKIDRVRADQAVNEDVIPARDYIVRIKSISGDVRGALAASTLTSVHSISADIQLEILPVLDVASPRAIVDTESISGGLGLRILEPLWIQDGHPASSPLLDDGLERVPPDNVPYMPIGDGDPYRTIPRQGRAPLAPAARAVRAAESKLKLRSMEVRHKTRSGTVSLRFPGLWQGNIDLSSVSGDLSARGQDVRVIKKGKQWPGVNNILQAVAGPGDGSQVRVDTTSGDVDVLIGDA